jgi:hypothetical protein
MACGNNIPANLPDPVQTGQVPQQMEKDISTVDSMENLLAQINAYPTRTQLEDVQLAHLT